MKDNYPPKPEITAEDIGTLVTGFLAGLYSIGRFMFKAFAVFATVHFVIKLW